MAEQLPSKKQHELLEYIEAFIKSNGYGPSYREIMRALDYKSVSTVAVHVDGLITRGYLNKRDRSARSLEIVGTPQTSGNSVEKTGDNLHKQWLVDLIKRKIKDSAEDQVVERRRILLAALTALGFEEERMQINDMFEEKRIDNR